MMNKLMIVLLWCNVVVIALALPTYNVKGTQWLYRSKSSPVLDKPQRWLSLGTFTKPSDKFTYAKLQIKFTQDLIYERVYGYENENLYEVSLTCDSQNFNVTFVPGINVYRSDLKVGDKWNQVVQKYVNGGGDKVEQEYNFQVTGTTSIKVAYIENPVYCYQISYTVSESKTIIATVRTYWNDKVGLVLREEKQDSGEFKPLFRLLGYTDTSI
jgi:hypothetical protein